MPNDIRVSLLHPLEAIGYYNQELFKNIYNFYESKYGDVNQEGFSYCIIVQNPLVIMLKAKKPNENIKYSKTEIFDISSVEYCLDSGIKNRNAGPKVEYTIATVNHYEASMINTIEESFKKENKELSEKYSKSVKEIYIRLASEDNLIFDFKKKYQALKDYWILNNQELFLNSDENDLETKKEIVDYCDRYSPFIYQGQLIIRDYASAKFFFIDDSEGKIKIYGENSSYGLDCEIQLDEEFDWDLNCNGERWSFLFLKHIKQEKNLIALELDNNEVYFVNSIYEYCETIINFLYEELITKDIYLNSEEFEIEIETY